MAREDTFGVNFDKIWLIYIQKQFVHPDPCKRLNIDSDIDFIGKYTQFITGAS